MTRADDPRDVLSAVPLEDVALSVDELALACAVQRDWVVERVGAGLLGRATFTAVQTSVTTTEWRFSSPELVRARRLRAMERDFDANPELAAFTVDLIEEVERLRHRLRAAGLDERG